MYSSDPSGNYSGWKATCIGANHASAQSILKQDYKDDDADKKDGGDDTMRDDGDEKEKMMMTDAIRLAIKVMSKTLDTAELTSEKSMSFICKSP